MYVGRRRTRFIKNTDVNCTLIMYALVAAADSVARDCGYVIHLEDGDAYQSLSISRRARYVPLKSNCV